MALENNVDKPTAAADALNAHYEILNALLCGTAEMRKLSTKALPMFPGEDTAAYNARKDTATLFPAYARTVAVLSARPFSEPVKIDEKSPAEFREVWAKDVDNEGSSIDEFAARLLSEALGYGFAGILVDAPNYPEDQKPKTREQEKAAGLRPYLCSIKAQSILGWRFRETPNGYRFTMLRFMETVTETSGEFGEVQVTQIRVLEPKRWRIFRKATTAQGTVKVGDWVVHKEGTTELDYVPFVPVYGKYQGFMKSKPPLLDLAHMNVEHWQSKSDQQTILHVARVPILVVIGGDDKFVLKVGASQAVNLPANGKMEFVEHTGAAIDAGQKSLDALELLMRQAGAELLVVHSGPRTATEVWSDNESGMSTLQRTTLNLQASLNIALGFMCEMGGVEATAKVEIFNDFGVQMLEMQSAEMVFKMPGAGLLSKETAFKEMQRRGIVDGSLDWEDEQERIESEGGSLGGMDFDLDPATGLPVKKPKEGENGDDE